jgi:hypothetical protein
MPTELSYKKRLKNIKAKAKFSTGCYHGILGQWKSCGQLWLVRENPVTLWNTG